MFLAKRKGKDDKVQAKLGGENKEEMELIPKTQSIGNHLQLPFSLDSPIGFNGRNERQDPSYLLKRKIIQVQMGDSTGQEKIGIQNRLNLYRFRRLQEQMNGDGHNRSTIKKLRGVTRVKQRKKSRKHSNTSMTKELKGRRCLINPMGTFKRCWETFKFVILIYTFVYLPLKVTIFSEQEERYTDLTYIFDKCIDFVFLIDMVLTFFTPVPDKYDMATNHKVIAKLYLKGWFVLDLLTLIPFDELLTFTLGEENVSNLQIFVTLVKVARLFRLVKLLRLFKSFDFKNSDNYIINFMAVISRGTPLMVIMPNFLLIIFSVHVYSCIYYYIGYQNNSNTGWITINHLEITDLLDQYINTFYFVIQTFSTVGYGDVLSYRFNEGELIFRLIIMVTGVLIFSLFTGQIVNTRNSALSMEEALELKTNKLKEITKKYNLPMNIYYNILETYKTPKEEGKKHDLSALNKEELDTFDYNKFVNKYYGVGLFSEDIEDRDFVLNLGRAGKVKQYLADQIIYSRGEPAVIFYIILSGDVLVETSYFQNINLVNIKKGFFGEYEIIQNINRLFTIKAKTLTTVLTLHSTDFKKLFITTEDTEFANYFIEKSKTRWEKFVDVDDEINQIFIRRIFWRQVFNAKYKKQNKKAIAGWMGGEDLKKTRRRTYKLGTSQKRGTSIRRKTMKEYPDE